MRQSKQIRRKSDKKSELLPDNIPGKTKALMINNTVAPTNPDYNEHRILTLVKEFLNEILRYHIAIMMRTTQIINYQERFRELKEKEQTLHGTVITDNSQGRSL